MTWITASGVFVLVTFVLFLWMALTAPSIEDDPPGPGGRVT